MTYRLMLSILVLLAALTDSFSAGISATTNGIYVVIGSWPTNDPVRFDNPLIFLPFSDTVKTEVAYPLDPAFGVKVRMTDANGKEVPKTAVGKRFGSEFDQLHSLDDTRLWPIDVGDSYKDNQGMGGAHFFSDFPTKGAGNHLTPKDLFEIDTAGIYTLEIQMQMFYDNPKSTNAWQRDLIRFPPVTLKVVKAPDKEAGKP